MPPNFLKGQVKTLIPSLMSQVGDKALRADVMVCLAKSSKLIGADQINPYIIGMLDGCDNPEVKLQCFSFLYKNFDQLQLTKADSQTLMRSTIQGVTDRVKDVRDQAELMLAKLIPITGLDLVSNLTKDYKDAVKTQIRGLLVKLGY